MRLHHQPRQHSGRTLTQGSRRLPPPVRASLPEEPLTPSHLTNKYDYISHLSPLSSPSRPSFILQLHFSINNSNYQLFSSLQLSYHTISLWSLITILILPVSMNQPLSGLTCPPHSGVCFSLRTLHCFMWELYYYFSTNKYHVEPGQINNFPYFSLWKALSIPLPSSTMKIKRKL